jgi:hypothetical protein
LYIYTLSEYKPAGFQRYKLEEEKMNEEKRNKEEEEGHLNILPFIKMLFKDSSKSKPYLPNSLFGIYNG